MDEEHTPREPVSYIPTDDPNALPAPGIGLCLSGGGYRAMLFHLGAIWRLYELGTLFQLERISSVSGGSITAGLLGLRWDTLRPGHVREDFVPQLVGPIRTLARHTVDLSAIAKGIFTRNTVSETVAEVYDEILFQGATLQDLPDQPRFVMNATNVQSGALWRFAKPYMRDWRVGEVKNPRVSIATAVAASSAFPPVLSPAVLDLKPESFTPGSGKDLQVNAYMRRVVLSDGGVYDNLGLETVWKRLDTVLVSDGGGKMEPDSDPDENWLGHSIRVLDVIDNQVRSLRKRQLISSFQDKIRKGTYWGIRSDVAEYQLLDPLDCPHHKTMALARIDTRLAELEDLVQERLINWGYAACDTAMRRHVLPPTPRPHFPYANAGLG